MENSEKPKLNEEDVVKRYLPVAAVGTFISLVDIIESCKDSLMIEMPELLQIDLEKTELGEDIRRIAYTCLLALIKKHHPNEKLVIYNAVDLAMNHDHDHFFVGMPIMLMNDSETKVQFIERVGILIASLNLKYESIPDNPLAEESVDNLQTFEADTVKQFQMMMCMINDTLTVLQPRSGPEDRDDTDDGYDIGVHDGMDINYEFIQVCLYKMWKKGKLKCDSLYDFVDDLHNTGAGMSDEDRDKWGALFQQYFEAEKTSVGLNKTKKPRKKKTELLLEDRKEK